MRSLKEEFNSSLEKTLFPDNIFTLNKVREEFDFSIENEPCKIISKQHLLLRINISIRYLQVKKIQAPFNSSLLDAINEFYDALLNHNLEEALLVSHKILEKSCSDEGLDFLYGYIMSCLYFDHYFSDIAVSRRTHFNQIVREKILSVRRDSDLNPESIKQFFTYLLFDNDDYELYTTLNTLLAGGIRNNFFLCIGLLKTLRHLLSAHTKSHSNANYVGFVVGSSTY